MNSDQKKRILILSANPRDTYRLRSDEEIREIRSVLERSASHEDFTVEVHLATPVAELQALFLKHRPQIVHFCGHGEEDGLLFEDESGMKQQVPVDALAELFKLCKKSIECVILNACYSQAQGEAIHQHIPCVVGMQSAIGDRSAILFATGFYTALGNGCSYHETLESFSQTPMVKAHCILPRRFNRLFTTWTFLIENHL